MVMSFGGIGMSGMYGGGNMYQNVKATYGCAPYDFSERPHVAPYPMEVIPKTPEPVIHRSWFGRLMNKLYG